MQGVTGEKFMKSLALAFAGLACVACTQPQMSEALSGRELRPQKAGINVGSLYFAREAPTNDLSRPVNLERLCEINLAKYDIVSLQDTESRDIDLTRQLEATGALSGIKNYFVTLGLSGGFSDYFDYKLTNVRDKSITLTEAEKIFNDRAFQSDCKYWRANVSRERWARYQVLSLTTGDIVLQQKNAANLSADVQAKISVAEPALKASLKRDYKLIVTGKGLVVAVSPVIRD